jgi:hypothetical protein
MMQTMRSTGPPASALAVEAVDRAVRELRAGMDCSGRGQRPSGGGLKADPVGEPGSQHRACASRSPALLP